MSQAAYPPGGYDPADGPPPMPPRPEDGPPPTRATARVPQPPAWAPPASGPPQPGSAPPPGVYGGGFGGPPPSFGQPSSAPPASGPPSYEPSAPPASGRASASASVPTFNPGAGYPPPHGGPEPSRFANLRYDDPAIEQPRKSRRGLIIGVVIAAVVVLALAGAGVFLFLNKTSQSASFAVNSCVKKSDKNAIAVACTDPGAYQIVSKVDTVDKCPDKGTGQPYVVLQESGKPDQVLCLKPAH